MTRINFIRVSGWGMMLAALFLLLTFVESADRIPFFLSAIVLITLGLVGIRARYEEHAGNTARIVLGVGIFGGIMAIVTHVLWQNGLDNGRILLNLAMGMMFGDLFVFGLVAQGVKPMPRGNWLPALAGFWWVFLVISAYVIPPANRQNVPDWASYSIFLMMAFFLALLGFVLQADAQHARVNDSPKEGALQNGHK